MTILILGASEWLPKKQPAIPELLREALPWTWPTRGSRRMSPLDVRVALATLLTEKGAPAIVMEAEEPRAPANLTRKFRELLEKHWVEEFYLYWPFGAARSGMDVEVGFLLEWMTAGKSRLPPEHVTVFYEDDGAERRAASVEFGRDGRLNFVALERTRRTRYYADLVDLGALVRGWKNHSDLVERVLARAGSTE